MGIGIRRARLREEPPPKGVSPNSSPRFQLQTRAGRVMYLFHQPRQPERLIPRKTFTHLSCEVTRLGVAGAPLTIEASASCPRALRTPRARSPGRDVAGRRRLASRWSPRPDPAVKNQPRRDGLLDRRHEAIGTYGPRVVRHAHCVNVESSPRQRPTSRTAGTQSHGPEGRTFGPPGYRSARTSSVGGPHAAGRKEPRNRAEPTEHRAPHRTCPSRYRLSA